LQNASDKVTVAVMSKPKISQSIYPNEFRSACPVASLLDIVGDKWTLVVVRDLFLHKHRYGDFLTSPESIPTNILAERLKRLEAAGIIKRELYQDNPPRAEYFLTSKGADLEPVLRAMLQWGKQYIPGVIFPVKTKPPEIRN
jgi:DNA-binding HxlR family transcriptional regulator